MQSRETKRPLLDRPAFLLTLGGALVVAANLRWGVGLLAWIAPVPLLRYLRITSGWRARVTFVAAVALAWIAATTKIVTPPLPLAFALLGVAFAAPRVAGYLAADAMRRRLGERAGVAAFPAVMIVLEWLQFRFTHLGTWGAAANTQLDDLPLLQIASVGGITAVSVLVHGVGASLESLLAAPSRSSGRIAAAALAAVAAAHVLGAARVARPFPDSPETVTVAAIGTLATFDGTSTPDDATRARTLDRLDEDTRTAARAGARVAVWTEAAALVMPGEEEDFVARVRRLGAEERVHVVAAYIVPKRAEPLLFENKYVWVRPDGAVDHTYFKHEPAPGEPAVVGTGPLPLVDAEVGRMSGALCYDYDFPALSREHGALGVDLVALPSSDWRGIDPIHTEMAALRAVEQGVSIVRSTRFGLSAGIDPTGRMRARVSSFDTNEKVALVSMPRHGVDTIYRHVGDVPVYASVALLLGLVARGLLSSRFGRARPADGAPVTPSAAGAARTPPLAGP